MSRKKKRKAKYFMPSRKFVVSIILMLFGIVLIVWWMPIWIWFVILGTALITIGISIFK